MVTVHPKWIFGKLNVPSRQTLEAAAGLTLSRTHYTVEVEHWLLKLAEVPSSDFAAICAHFDVDVPRLIADLNRVLDDFKTGNERPPSLSPDVVTMMREAWVLGSLEGDAPLIRTGHLLLVVMSENSLSRSRYASRQFDKISAEALRRDFASITAETTEAGKAPAAATGEREAISQPTPRAAGPSAHPALDQFTIDLTAQARKGEVDPVLGRDNEIRQIADILLRRRQNNPILTGEAGVGKTAVVEGFALRVAEGDVPDPLKSVSVRTLDLGLLQAGAGVRGEFENRLKSVINEVRASPMPIILFIDEAHTLIGAGGPAGQSDAANLLKPALARGELRTIAATTWVEYKKYFEQDPALARRFQTVKVEEPTEEAAIDMMRGLVGKLEAHHNVRIVDEAVRESVRLSSRYIPARQLPDKCVSLLDTACARVAMSQTAVPPAVDDRRRRLQRLNNRLHRLRREQASGGGLAADAEAIAAEITAVEADLRRLEAQWEREHILVAEIRALHDALENESRPAATKAAGSGQDITPGVDQGATAAPSPSVGKEFNGGGGESKLPATGDERLSRLQTVEAELARVQGEMPLIQVSVDGQAVADVVGTWTGIPVGRMVTDEIRMIEGLEEAMAARIKGQPHALAAIARAIRTSRAKLTDPRKPVGVFLMVGTSGVGKTETALCLADLLYGGEHNVTVINMSEFKEEYRISLLTGAPPGYKGYEEGGVLTEAVRRRPHSIVLLDEVEKAHRGVQDIFYDMFDKGMLRDGQGRDVDFKNTIIIMTSNAGSEMIADICANPAAVPDVDALTGALRPALLRVFDAPFLGRTTIVPYLPLRPEILREITVLQMNRIGDRVRENYKADFAYDDALVDNIVQRCTEVESGARNVEAIIRSNLLPELSKRFLAHMADGAPTTSVRVSLDAEGGFAYTVR